MSDESKKETSEKTGSNDAPNDSLTDKDESESGPSGPSFTEGPDPLAGVKKSATDALASMEGKTVSMKLYVGTIIGVILLMLLARCGG